MASIARTADQRRESLVRGEPKFAPNQREIVIVGTNHRHRQLETRGADGALHNYEGGVGPVCLPPRHDGLMGAETLSQFHLGQASPLSSLGDQVSTGHP